MTGWEEKGLKRGLDRQRSTILRQLTRKVGPMRRSSEWVIFRSVREFSRGYVGLYSVRGSRSVVCDRSSILSNADSIALNMLRKKLDLEMIAEVTGLTIDQLQLIQVGCKFNA
jgi:hypothetical protein